MQKRTSFFLTLLAIAALGAGCGGTSPAAETPVNVAPSAEQTAVSDSPQATQPATTAPSPDGQQPSSTSSTTTVTPSSPLAFPGILPESEIANKLVRIETTKGEIVFEVLPKEGPRAASNFVYLANQKFYDGLTFHRVVPGFVIQGGDPRGDGTGGPGYQFEDDTVNLPYKQGIVAMANAGPNTNGSQFFIMLADNPLPPSYSIFGRVVKGMDVVQKIGVGDKMTSVIVEAKK